MKLARILILLTLLSSTYLQAQAQTQKNNIVRISLPHLIWNSINLSYERVLNKNLSLNLTTNIQIPLSFDDGYRGDLIEDLNEEWETGYFRNGVEIGGFDLMPELRFYPGQNATAPTGFFLSAMIKYSNYNWTLPFHWTDDNEIVVEYQGETVFIENIEVDVDTDLNTQALSFGIGVGGQWIVGEVVSLGVDLGLGWGLGWGDGTFTALPETLVIPDFDSSTLTEDERSILIGEVILDLAEEIEEGLVEEDYPLDSQISIDISSDQNSVYADGNFPWPFLRLGFTVGFAF